MAGLPWKDARSEVARIYPSCLVTQVIPQRWSYRKRWQDVLCKDLKDICVVEDKWYEQATRWLRAARLESNVQTGHRAMKKNMDDELHCGGQRGGV